MLIRVYFVTYLINFFFKPIIKWLNIDNESDRSKLPESAWKFLAYCGLWTYCSYVLIFSGKYDYFTNPYDIWNG